MQVPARVVANKQNGAKGGLATLAKHGAEFAQERASRGGQAVLARYGSEYFRFLATRSHKRKKGWPKGRARKLTPQIAIA